MSIYIKGMEMPENCTVCPIRSWNGEDDICPFSKVEALSIGRQAKCPLVEIPPHGRLIDADELFQLLDGGYDVDMDELPETKAALLEMIANAPTIIPADKEEPDADASTV